MDYHDVKLLASAAKQSQWPLSSLPEILFVGRSNAGKSTLINALVNRKKLAYSAKTPGKTRLLHFYAVDNRVVFTDAPGYGYAAGNHEAAKTFVRLIDPYISRRPLLKAMILVCDCRREKPSDDDLLMVDYARQNHIALICALTKTDKISYGKLCNNRSLIAEALGIPEGSLIATSGEKKTGFDDLWRQIDRIIDQAHGKAGLI